MSDDLLVIGVGNEWRRDDGVGPWVAGEVRRRGVLSLAHASDGAGLIDLFAAYPHLVAVDATRSGAAPGTRTAFDAVATPLPSEFFHYSTHSFGLAEAVETARALGQLPRRLIVHGIEGTDFSAGTGLSPAVRAAAEHLVEEIAAQTRQTSRP